METHLVAPEDAGVRVDIWLVEQYADRSRSEIQRWIRDGHVEVDGDTVKPSMRLAHNQEINVTLPPPPENPIAVPQAIPLDIIFEDSDLVVVNKPAGMVVHPAPGHTTGTLVNAVLHHCPDIAGIGGELRPGIVHRLDKGTSGLIVVAKNNFALRNLQSQFKDRTVDKRYTALVEGRISPDQGRISVPLGRHPTDRKRQAAYPTAVAQSSPRVREAITEYDTIAQYALSSASSGGPANFSLVAAKLLTGRTHQLRVHFAWMKHPIVGDTTYGYRKQRLPIGRLFLHACKITFALPSSGQCVTFKSPLPHKLASIIDRLSTI